MVRKRGDTTIYPPADVAGLERYMETLLNVENLGVNYGSVQALHDATFRLGAGSICGLIGMNGSGKSTLLNLIGTLDRPTSGTVEIDGLDVAALSDADLSAVRARRIGFVFQQFHLADGVTAVDNVADGLLYLGVARSERRARAKRALERVGLGHRLGHRPHQMSGGERQRVAIARAFLKDAPVLLLDEVTSALDGANEAVVTRAMEELSRGRTVLVIAHRLSTIRRADRIVVLVDGAVEAVGAHNELYAAGGTYRRFWDDQEAIDRWRLVGAEMSAEN